MAEAYDTAELEFCCTSTPAEHMLDYNGHLNVAYYAVLFEDAARAIFGRYDVSQAYRERSDCALFAAEVHTVFLREVPAGESVSIYYRLVEAAGSKLHGMFFMVRAGDGSLAATQEIMFLHIDLNRRKTAPLPQPQAGRLAELQARQRSLPEPPEKGRFVGQRKPNPAAPAVQKN
jgi:acyl-CoA thioester hydrolase